MRFYDKIQQILAEGDIPRTARTLWCLRHLVLHDLGSIDAF